MGIKLHRVEGYGKSSVQPDGDAAQVCVDSPSINSIIGRIRQAGLP